MDSLRSLRSWDRFDYAVGFSPSAGAPTSLESPNWLVRFFHSFPHFKRDFSQANSTFKPENDEYRESVLFLLAVPIIWLLLTLLIFLIYFCVRCCQACCKNRNDEKNEVETKGRGATCCRYFWLTAFIIVGILSMGIGLYGNEGVTNGSRALLISLRQLGHRVVAARERTDPTQDAHDVDLAIFDSLDKRLDGTRAPREEKNRMIDLLTTVKKDMMNKKKELNKLTRQLSKEINARESAFDYNRYMPSFRSGEDYRWLATAGFFCWTIFVLLLLIVGLARKSKCCLFIFAAFATITLVIDWTVVSAYLGVAIGVADLCFDPQTFLRDYGGYVHEKNLNRFHYLLNCSHSTPNGGRYMKELQAVTAAIHGAKNAMHDLELRASQFTSHKHDRDIPPLLAKIKEKLNLDASSSRVMSATALLECRGNQHHLLDAIHGLCVTGVNGLALVLLGSAVLGMSFTVLILIASCSWRKFRTDENFIAEVDQENDPFLSGNYTTGPHYMSRRYQTESPEPAPHHQHGGGRSRGHNKQTTVADVSVSSSGSAAAPRTAPAASNPTYSEHPMGSTGPCGTPPLNSFSGSRTPPPPYGHSGNHHGSHHDSIYPSAPVL